MPKKKILKWSEKIFIIVIVIIITTVVVRAFDRQSGEKASENKSGTCPADMVFVPGGDTGFCIDKYEASAGDDCLYKEPGTQNETRINLDIKGCFPISEPGVLPWRNISRDQAVLACAKAGKRLATNHQWYEGVLGTPDKEANWQANDCQVNKNWPAQPGQTGYGPECLSSAGAYDMVGNVWEWVEGTVNEGELSGKILPDAGYVNAVDDEGLPAATNQNTADLNYKNDYYWIKKSGVRAIARGGYWDNQADAGQYSLYIVLPPEFAGPAIGFRCAKLIY